MMAEKNFGSVDPKFFGDFMSNVARCSNTGAHVLLQAARDPQEDLLTALAHAKVQGDLLPDEYLDGSWLLIVFAGNDTTRNSISGTMKLLTEFAAQKRACRPILSLLPTMVDEAIRMVSPGHVHAPHGDEGHRDPRAEDRRGREGDHVLRRGQSRSGGVRRSRPLRRGAREREGSRRVRHRAACVPRASGWRTCSSRRSIDRS